MATKPRTLCQMGETIGGRYWAYKALKGGMGEVYLCFDKIDKIPKTTVPVKNKPIKTPRMASPIGNDAKLTLNGDGT